MPIYKKIVSTERSTTELSKKGDSSLARTHPTSTTQRSGKLLSEVRRIETL